MIAQGKSVYDFWAEQGRFRWLDPKRVPGPTTVLEVRKGSLSLLHPPAKASGLWRVVYSGFLLTGALIGSIAYWTASAADVNLILRAFVLSTGIVVVCLAFVIVTRQFPAFLARRSPKPGLVLEVARADYHHFYHHFVVRSKDGEFELTVGGWRSRVRRSMLLSQCGGNLPPP